MEEQFSILSSILFPKNFKYELSEKLFLDIWEEYGFKDEILNRQQIYEILYKIVEKSKGNVILDHYSKINYDNILKVTYEAPYTKIYWKDFDNYRKQYINKTISDSDMMRWCLWGYATYSYMLLNIKKIKFLKENNHIFILIQLNLISRKEANKALIKNGDEKISEESNIEDLYDEYMFFEGDKKYLKKHICQVCNLPYYTCLIQPKENNKSTRYSFLLLLRETFNEIEKRIKSAMNILNDVNQYDYDEIYANGNKIRRVLEYALKHFCVYNKIEIEINEKYSHIKLGDLKKAINKEIDSITIEQSMINTANELSHDTGKVLEKENVLEFGEKSLQLIYALQLYCSEDIK